MYVNPLKLQSGPAFQGRGDGPRGLKGAPKGSLSPGPSMRRAGIYGHDMDTLRPAHGLTLLHFEQGP
jgi:hypothetical protein